MRRAHWASRWALGWRSSAPPGSSDCRAQVRYCLAFFLDRPWQLQSHRRQRACMIIVLRGHSTRRQALVSSPLFRHLRRCAGSGLITNLSNSYRRIYSSHLSALPGTRPSSTHNSLFDWQVTTQLPACPPPGEMKVEKMVIDSSRTARMDQIPQPPFLLQKVLSWFAACLAFVACIRIHAAPGRERAVCAVHPRSPRPHSHAHAEPM